MNPCVQTHNIHFKIIVLEYQELGYYPLIIISHVCWPKFPPPPPPPPPKQFAMDPLLSACVNFNSAHIIHVNMGLLLLYGIVVTVWY